MPVMVAAGWTEAQRRAYVLADNRLALDAGRDEDLLGSELVELGDLSFDLPLTGFSDSELSKLMQMFSKLLSNAITHGAKDQPIIVEAKVVNGLFELSVCKVVSRSPRWLWRGYFSRFIGGMSNQAHWGWG